VVQRPADSVTAQWTASADWVKSTWPDKPFIISETGAGGVAGNHSHPANGSDANASRWSEEYQRLVDGLDAGVAMTDSDIAGLALWQFTDINVGRVL
jgi:hypothetical protein